MRTSTGHHGPLRHPVSKWGGRRVQRLRAKWEPLVMAGQCVCPFCRAPIRPGQPWDLDHRIPKILAPEAIWDEGNHRPAHATCNRRHGAALGNRSPKRRGRKPRRQVPSTSRPEDLWDFWS